MTEESKISFNRHCDKRVDDLKELFQKQIEDMKEATKLAREEVKEARRSNIWLTIFALIGLLSGLISLIIQYQKI